MPAFFHNRLLMLVLTLGLGLGMASSVDAETKPAGAEAVEKLQDRVIELEKETAVLKAELGARIDAQDKLISVGIGEFGAQVTELSNQTTQLGNYISYTSLALVVIGLVAGVFAFRRAKEIAKEQSMQWFKDNQKGLTEILEALNQQAERVRQHAEEASSSIVQNKQNVIDETAGFRRVLDKTVAANDKGEKPPEDILQQVERDARNLDAKSRSQWTIDDFYNYGLYSFTSGDYGSALVKLNALINMLTDSNMLTKGFHPDLYKLYSKAQFYRGLALGKLGRDKDARAAAEDLISRFGNRTEPEWLDLLKEARRQLGDKS